MYSLSSGPMRTADAMSELLPDAQVLQQQHSCFHADVVRRGQELYYALQARMHKKLAQLAKVHEESGAPIMPQSGLARYQLFDAQVIKHLNSKGAENSNNLQETAGEYEVEIEQILQSTATRLSAFSKQMALQVEEERINQVVKVTSAPSGSRAPATTPCCTVHAAAKQSYHVAQTAGKDSASHVQTWQTCSSL